MKCKKEMGFEKVKNEEEKIECTMCEEIGSVY